MRHRYFSVGIYALAFVTGADQISKWLVLDSMGGAQKSIPVTSFLNIVLVWNKGVTFGMFNHEPRHNMPYILMGVAAVVLALLGRWLWRTHSRLVALALGGIMGGAIGNVIDRARHGAVVDFLDFYYSNHHWYAFNVADAAIATGVALLLIDGMVRSE